MLPPVLFMRRLLTMWGFRSNYQRIWALICPSSIDQLHESTKSRQDFATELYTICLEDAGPGRHAYAPRRATWGAVLHATFRYTDTEVVNMEQWLDSITAALTTNQIDCMPGSHCSRITHLRVVRLVGYTVSIRANTARKGGLKRDAIEAEERAMQPLKKQVIDFGYAIPFTTIPSLIEEGFRAQEKLFAKGNQKVLEHYHVARNCLQRHLGNPVCDLLLMLVLTLSMSSVTPTVPANSHQFDKGPNKERSHFAANMVTRMLWFWKREEFPWHEDRGMVLCVAEMTKKTEHKGVNNRLLRELGWIVQKHSGRDNPRNSDVELQSADKLAELYSELLRLRSDPPGFVAQVYHSHDPIWLERSFEIIHDVPATVKRPRLIR